MPLTKKDLDDAFENQKKDIQAMIDSSVSTIKDDIIKTLRDENTKFQEKVSILEDQIWNMEKTMETNFQYQRNCNVIISGIPSTIDHDNLEGIVINLFNNVCHHNITERDIEAVHRISFKSPLVLVKFMNKKDATALVDSRSSIVSYKNDEFGLGESNKLYVEHQLTPYMGLLAYRCRCLKRKNVIINTKVQKGIVKILVNSEHGV